MVALRRRAAACGEHDCRTNDLVDGTRKFMGPTHRLRHSVLIIGDFGMRKPPRTAAETCRELVLNHTFF
jgi:hypothetical protein